MESQRVCFYYDVSLEDPFQRCQVEKYDWNETFLTERIMISVVELVQNIDQCFY